MAMAEVTIIIAFLAGIVSFLSPCMLPVLPGFLSYLTGTSLGEAKKNRMDMFLNSLLFVLGFSVIFSLIGVLLNTVLEKVAYDAQAWLARIGGIIIIFFGLYLMGLVKLPFLEGEHKIGIGTKFKSRYVTSFLFGSSFAAGWTPCVSAALGAILGLAATQPGIAFYLLMAYTLGLGVPFLIVGVFAGEAAGLIKGHEKKLKQINVIFGFVLVVLGILAFTQQLNRIANLEILNKILLS